MNNSDILVALSLGLTAIIVLFQADAGLLKVKIRKGEITIFWGLWLLIILLCNCQVFERNHWTFYFSVKGFYLMPNEWALVIFLTVFGLICYRVFAQKIFNKDPEILLGLLKKYRSEKKIDKLLDLLILMMKLENFDSTFGEDLDDIVFNDHHLIEQFCSDSPEIIIHFTSLYPGASINGGYYFYYILMGLFADTGNQIYSEIRRYKREEIKKPFLAGWDYNVKEVTFGQDEDYATSQRIIGWLVSLMSFPTHLQRDIKYFLSEFHLSAGLNNEKILSEDEIETVLSRDPLYNSIQLFRIILVEISITKKRVNEVLDRYLAMLYSAWDFVQSHTELGEKEVQLNNDAYTINEYLLKYIFEGYCSLFVLNHIKKPATSDGKDISGWTIKQVMQKLNSLWKSSKVSMDSKVYFMEQLVDLYFELPEYLPVERVERAGFTIMYELKENSLDSTPFGDPIANREIFQVICAKYDFYKKNNTSEDLERAEKFYSHFLPYSQEWKYRICDI
jgi:hypothetical protein